MIGVIVGKIIAAPIRIINVPVKAAKAVLDMVIGEPVTYEDNAMDDIADVVEKSTRRIFLK